MSEHFSFFKISSATREMSDIKKSDFSVLERTAAAQTLVEKNRKGIFFDNLFRPPFLRSLSLNLFNQL